ncbi:MAG: DUF4124 domain-containing protein [Caldimonas sp.]
MKRVAAIACAALVAVEAHGAIFTCVDAKGQKHTQDHLIAACADREQIELNNDGSKRRVIPPSQTEEERAAADARERAAAVEAASAAAAVRSDRALLKSYPDQAAHDRARREALDEVRTAIRIYEARVEQLNRQRKPLLDEKEFYVGKELPVPLKLALDGNGALLDAQKQLIQGQQDELKRIDLLFDKQLAKLKQLWLRKP